MSKRPTKAHVDKYAGRRLAPEAMPITSQPEKAASDHTKTRIARKHFYLGRVVIGSRDLVIAIQDEHPKVPLVHHDGSLVLPLTRRHATRQRSQEQMRGMLSDLRRDVPTMSQATTVETSGFDLSRPSTSLDANVRAPITNLHPFKSPTTIEANSIRDQLTRSDRIHPNDQAYAADFIRVTDGLINPSAAYSILHLAMEWDRHNVFELAPVSVCEAPPNR